MIMNIDGEGASEVLRASFEAYYARLVHLSFLLADDPSVAEDIVQDAFVRSAQRIVELDEPARLGYLRVAVLNGWRNRHRHTTVTQRWRRRYSLAATRRRSGRGRELGSRSQSMP